ncbi:ADP-ribosylglycohydrolase family protein [candidate division KSB1 bacterium]|nr:ADP-ribosylglycohydrolase family protein [candidate division KSB1 bacterium]
MKSKWTLIISTIFLLVSCSSEPVTYRVIPVKTYVDKMKAGWIGQMAGVGWGAPTEFLYNSTIIPEENVPDWKPEMINQFNQDDIYVEMTFLRTLEQYGYDVDIRQAGIDFANSGYMLWHANKAGRDNLRSGIAPPWSGHPEYNSHADDIDYQIEADYAGLISPGLPQAVVDLGELFGRLMNYGDGLYGGQFVAGMYAEAFFETDIEKIIQAGLACIPKESAYTEAIRDVIGWYHENPENWQVAWDKIETKYQDNPENRKFSCSGPDSDFNIDAKINGAYIVMGLLYGQGDLDKTIVISMRCGQDSDCNPSNAAGVLATIIGASNLPDNYTSALDLEPKFSYTEYNFNSLTKVCEKLARDAVLRYGGRIEENGKGEEVFVIPVRNPKLSKLEKCWEPNPAPANVSFTENEMAQIQFHSRKPEEFIHIWEVSKPYTKKGVEPDDLLDIAFEPERNIDAVVWKQIPMGEKGYSRWLVELDKFIKGENRVAYIRNEIWSETDLDVVMELGSDDGVKVWINGKLIHTNNIFRGCNAGEDKVPVHLNAGWNTCMMKISQGTGGWAAAVNIVDENKEAIKSLKYRRP